MAKSASSKFSPASTPKSGTVRKVAVSSISFASRATETLSWLVFELLQPYRAVISSPVASASEVFICVFVGCSLNRLISIMFYLFELLLNRMDRAHPQFAIAPHTTFEDNLTFRKINRGTGMTRFRALPGIAHSVSVFDGVPFGTDAAEPFHLPGLTLLSV